MKIVMVGQGAFGRKHLDGLKNIPDVEVVEPRRRQQGVDGSRREAIRHSALDDELRRGARAARRRRGDPDVADASARGAGRRGHARRQARRDRDPDRRLARRRAQDSRNAKGHRQDRDGGPHAPLQSVASMGREQDQEGRAQAPAARRADVFLPPQEHQPRGQAAQLDGPLAVAPRVPHGRPVPLPDRRGAVGRARATGPAASRAQDRDGHEHRHAHAVGRPLQPVVVVQQRRAAGHVLPLHLRQRHVHRALRRSVRRQGQARSTCRASPSR